MGKTVNISWAKMYTPIRYEPITYTKIMPIDLDWLKDTFEVNETNDFGIARLVYKGQAFVMKVRYSDILKRFGDTKRFYKNCNIILCIRLVYNGISKFPHVKIIGITEDSLRNLYKPVK